MDFCYTAPELLIDYTPLYKVVWWQGVPENLAKHFRGVLFRFTWGSPNLRMLESDLAPKFWWLIQQYARPTAYIIWPFLTQSVVKWIKPRCQFQPRCKMEKHWNFHQFSFQWLKILQVGWGLSLSFINFYWPVFVGIVLGLQVECIGASPAVKVRFGHNIHEWQPGWSKDTVALGRKP